MSIKRYNEKRNFKDTPEPVGKKAASKDNALRFVIQKHEASHLHYDFRLELNGVLLSWAVPKGPSLNPEDKRLAMHVEDHPMDYRRFEGIIPEGNYGAGTVMVWDEGTYCADPELDRAANEKRLADAYKKGKLTFYLSGTKLQGEFTLIKMHGRSRQENAWLLIKADDDAADRDSDVRDQDTSAISGRSMNAIAAAADDIWDSKDKVADKSAGSKRKIGAAPASQANKKANKKAASPAKKKKALKLASDALAIGGKKSGMPRIDGPQLAVLVDAPFDREGWIFEIKWDGYRTLGYYPPKDGTSLISRNGLSFDDKFSLIRDALQSLPCPAVVDGEIVALEHTGKSSFAKLQNHEINAANLAYYIFDLLYVDGVDIREAPLLERKKLLTRLLASCDERLQYSDHIETKGTEFFEAARQNDLEGIIAKNGLIAYQSGKRTRHWLKIKIEQRQEFIIAGYTAPRGSRSDFGSLILAYYSRSKAEGGIGAGKLRYAGHVGTGLDTRTRAELKDRMDRLVLKTSPFAEKPATNAATTWVKPELVCEVRYTEKTSDCHLRHPVFIGLREDKAARNIHWDIAEKAAPVVEDASEEAEAAQRKTSVKSPARKKAALKASAAAGKQADKQSETSGAKRTKAKASSKRAGSNVKAGAATRTKAKAKTKRKTKPKAKSASADDTADDGNGDGEFAKEALARDLKMLTIDGRRVDVTNSRRIYYPELKISKLDVIEYYRKIAPYLLPYLKDRPFVLHRFPRGIHHEGFYQKDNPQDFPSWIKSTTIHSESTGEDICYLVCQDEATLVYLVNLGCLEMNPWNSRIRKINKPDWMIFDLDPVETAFAQVVDVASVIHDIFHASGIPHYCKTSGKRGLHVAVPLAAKYDNETVRDMALAIAQLVHQELPGSTSLERSPSKRRNKVYLDYLQNGIGKTLAAPYSLRPVEYAGVATPLHWDEVNAKLDPKAFNIHTIMDRLASEGDLWKGILAEAIDLKAILKQADNN